MRCHPAPRPPGLRTRDHLLGVGTRLQAEGNPRGFLQRQIARGKSVGMAEAEQQIDVGGPGADAVQRDQRITRVVGLHAAQSLKVDRAF